MASEGGLADMRQYHGPQCNGIRWRSEDTEDEPKIITRSPNQLSGSVMSGRLVLNTGSDLGGRMLT